MNILKNIMNFNRMYIYHVIIIFDHKQQLILNMITQFYVSCLHFVWMIDISQTFRLDFIPAAVDNSSTNNHS